MEKISFEEALQKLEAIVDKLESGELELQEALKLFEEGVRLSVYCQSELKATDYKISKLIETLQGEVELISFED
ncbi:Exodeoxyribonuclease VII small subunit [Candidatus Syntrophocurvum alkaliphilum]|uniref:Exodeoxyribonuclease 7 small subunit n=1 Tax=Candidatus Syntrophocurvum alkaliphilum TaxID=2293317 RepID=A0A6I6D6Y7_9FIRM|nr:exodeoxyribonuclease VII small subunit [Candidatus Syntrophocurvum alkaliphilum]QGT98966.1 Exodeoxyribonuclease VII small subunit [Candidatus Syntrophocurvum alkaliphilum]